MTGASIAGTVRRLVAGIAVLLAALTGSLLAAGCGGSSGQGVAQVGTTTTTTTGSGSPGGSSSADRGRGHSTAYSACMRKNGVPKFPDPDSNGRLRLEVGAGTGIDPESAQFKAAARACQKLAPEGPSPAQRAEERKQLLALSACMRKNGVPNFPDPKFNPDGSGGITLERGVDRTPQFKAAFKVCEKQVPDPREDGPEGGTP